jgi:recombinational DNA repair protein RecT
MKNAYLTQKPEEFGLKNFEHRLINKLSSFIYKINNDIKSPSFLKTRSKEIMSAIMKIVQTNNSIKQSLW